MSGKRRSGNKSALIVIKRDDGEEAAHHGGAWKVAYADFMTAMMAFFLLMWLLNATTEDQKRGLADYFSPTASLIHTVSGTDLPFGGRTPFDHGAMVSDQGAMSVVAANSVAPPDPDEDDSEASAEPVHPNSLQDSGLEQGTASGNAAVAGPQSGTLAPGGGPALTEAAAPPTQAQTAGLLRAEQEHHQAEAFQEAAEQIRQAVLADPQLVVLASQLAIDVTPEGLRIQIMDQDRRPMFDSGSSVLLDRAHAFLFCRPVILDNISEVPAILKNDRSDGQHL